MNLPPEQADDLPVNSPVRMGTDPIGRLLWRYSLPAIVGMVVHALYDIVDRVFIGYGIGPLGLGGVTISFPLVLLTISFAILVGVGGNTLFSIRLGERRDDEAGRILGAALLLLFLVPLAVSILAQFRLDALLRLIGTTEELMPYARPYARILLGGIALGTTSHGLSHFIRSDGHPRWAMGAMVAGALANVILDPLFIFVFRWGMAGAAWATVLSQGIACAWSLVYFRSRWAHTRLLRRNLRLDWAAVVRPMLAIGFAPFAMNLANCFLNVVLHRGLGTYGGAPALAVMGILNSYMSLIFMPVFGLSQGAQPLLGYNYGARNYARVRHIFRVSVYAATGLMILGWATSQLLPAPILRVFVPADSNLISLGVRALRLFTLAFPLIGFPIMAGNLFQAIGRPVPAGFLALARQIVLFVPFLMIFPRFLGLDGIFLAAPASDILTFLVAGVLFARLRRELHRLEDSSAG